MSWICVKAIRRWADEEIETTGRDVLRRQAHRLADDVHAAMEELHKGWFDRHHKAVELLADTARRNVRAEAEVKRLTMENAEMREKIARLERQLKPVLECQIQRVDGLDSPDGEFMTSSEYGVCDSDGNEVDNHSIAEALNAIRAAQRLSMSAAAT